MLDSTTPATASAEAFPEASAVEQKRREYDTALRLLARMARELKYCGDARTAVATARERYERAVQDDEVVMCLAAERGKGAKS